jgi:hypothetical protein
MATGGVIGNGVRVGFSSTSPVSWTRLGALLNIEPPQFEVEQVDSTVHSGSKFRTSIPGMNAVSDMTLTILADLDETTTPAQNTLWTLNQAGTTVWWRYEVPVTRELTKCTPFEFQGYVKSYKLSIPIEDKQSIEVVIGFDGTTFTKYPAQTGFSIT